MIWQVCNTIQVQALNKSANFRVHSMPSRNVMEKPEVETLSIPILKSEEKSYQNSFEMPKVLLKLCISIVC